VERGRSVVAGGRAALDAGAKAIEVGVARAAEVSEDAGTSSKQSKSFLRVSRDFPCCCVCRVELVLVAMEARMAARIVVEGQEVPEI